MAAFVITQKSSDALDTPVFFAGETDSMEAVAIFTNRDCADSYLSRSNWDDHEVGELQSVQILRWFEMAREDGVDLVVVNPDVDHHHNGDPQRVISLRDPRLAFATFLRNDLIASLGSNTRQHSTSPLSEICGHYEVCR